MVIYPLHPTEKALCSIRARDVSTFKDSRYLNLVCNKEKPDEVAIFVFHNAKTNIPVLDLILPIYNDFRITQKEEVFILTTSIEDRISVAFEDEFVNDDEENFAIEQQNLFLATVGRSMNLAKKSGYTAETSHAFIDKYSSSKDIRNSTHEISSLNNRLNRLLRKRRAEFNEVSNLKVFTGTWNVNNKLPDEDLELWLQDKDFNANETSGDPLDPDDGYSNDVYAIGFQELDLSTEAFVFFNGSDKSELWCAVLQNTLPSRFVLLKTKQLASMLLVVFVERSILPEIVNVDSSYCSCGIMNVLGNKGGVGIRFRYRDTCLCFVNCHLAADMNQVERRNIDFSEIENRLYFTTLDKPNFPILYDGSETQRAYPQYTYIYDHDVVFWMGDLNYRIALKYAEVKNICNSGHLGKLKEFDQLKNEMKHGRCFKGYYEGETNFTPTYKYDPGTTIFDTSEKQRPPAWCDRVLWWSDREDVEQTAYSSCPELLISDHKPVYATFNVKAYKQNQEQLHAVQIEVNRESDRMTNAIMPEAKITTSLNFPDVRFGAPVEQELEIENTGFTIFKYKFIKVDTTALSSCTVKDETGVVGPGERFKTLVKVRITKDTLRTMPESNELSEFLILHLEGGRDYFVEISGNVLPTPMCKSLDQLILNDGPVRPSKNYEKDSLDVKDKPELIPLELWRLVEYIKDHGLDNDRLLIEPGHSAELDTIFECLATGDSFDSYELSIHSVVKAMKSFFVCLPNPIISPQLCQYCELKTSQQKKVIDRFASSHKAVFLYIISFGRSLLEHSNSNHLDANAVAAVFTPLLFPFLSAEEKRPPISSKTQKLINKRISFLLLFLVDEDKRRSSNRSSNNPSRSPRLRSFTNKF